MAADSSPLHSILPFESHWLDCGEGKLHYVDERPFESSFGDEPTLLFVHGNPTWSYHWRSLIEAYRATHRCVAIDHLGCGLSDKPQQRFRLADRIEHLSQLITKLDLKNITLVAQDWGGAIGLGAMLRHRDRLKRIVLLNTGAFPPPFIPWRIDVCRLPLLGKMALQGGNLFSRAAIRMTTTRQALSPEIAAAYLAPYDNWANRRAVYEFVADIPRSASHPTWKTLADIEASLPSLAGVPSLLVWGMKDWCFSPACLERFEAVWPNAHSIRLADAGHWVLEDAPAEVLAAMQKFTAAPLAEAASVPK